MFLKSSDTTIKGILAFIESIIDSGKGSRFRIILRNEPEKLKLEKALAKV